MIRVMIAATAIVLLMIFLLFIIALSSANGPVSEEDRERENEEQWLFIQKWAEVKRSKSRDENNTPRKCD